MAGDDDHTWEELSDEVRLSMRWASAMEVGAVGTRALVAGMIRAEGAGSPPMLLLNAFDSTAEELFTVIRSMDSLPPINPNAGSPARQFDLADLTPKAAAALAGSFKLRDLFDSGYRVSPHHLFASILDNDKCSGYRALAIALRGKTDLKEIRESLGEQLLGGVGRIPSRGGPIRDICFAPDGATVVSAGPDGLLRIWRIEGMVTSLFAQEESGVPQEAVQLSPDGRRLACGGADGEVCVYGLEGGFLAQLATLSSGKSPIVALAFAKNGLLAIGDHQGQIVISSADFEALAHSHRNPEITGPVALAFEPDGQKLVSADAGSLIRWAVSSMEVLASVRSQDFSSPLALVVSSEGPVLAHGSDGRTWRWDVRDGELEQIAMLGGRTLAATFTDDGAHLVVALDDGTVRMGSVDGADGWRIVGEAPDVCSLAISSDGNTLASGDGNGKVKIWRIGADTSYDGGAEWLSDRPTTADSFGRRRLASVLATRLGRISGEAVRGSFLLHLDGPWGAGKSSLLSLLEDELEAGADGDAWLIVRFDAWRQSAVGPPWWALLTALREELGESRGLFGRFLLRNREILRLMRGYLFSSLLGLLLVGVAVVLFLLLGHAESDVGGLAQTVSAVVAVATTVWLLARGAARALMWESASGAKLYEQAEQNPMRGLADHFAWLIARAEQRQVVFFIDDLDRCDEDYVVDLLESIQTLVRDAPLRSRKGRDRDSRPPFFVVAADGRWIRRSYEHAYDTFQDAVSEPGRRLGYLFLDKIFQLTLRVPKIGHEEQARYLDELLRPTDSPEPKATADFDAAAMSGRARIRESRDQREILRVVEEARPEARRQLEEAAVERLNEAVVERATEHELQKFASLLEPNPRSMKRFINAYSVALSTALIAGQLPDPDALALWTILRMRWPELADYLAKTPAVTLSILSEKTLRSGVPEGLLPICDDDALRALLAFGGGVLNPQKIEGMV